MLKTEYSYQNNSLQFFAQEEGRVRPKYDSTSNSFSFLYDYCIKDHLGYTRVVLTDEHKQDIYPAATLETGSLTTDTLFYNIDSTNIVANTSIPSLSSSYANNNGIPNPDPGINASANSTKMYRLNGATNKTGLGISLRVMAGDTVNVFGKMYWHSADVSTIQNNQPITGALTTFLSAFSSSPPVMAANEGAGRFIASSSSTTVPLDNWLNDSVPTPTNKPKAYINWILFNDQFVPVNSSSGFESVSDASDDLKSIMREVNINQNGYLYIYCSNESNTDVFFDNLQVVHNHGPLLQEDAFYPFGLEMSGISAKAAGSLANNYKFNSSSELNNDLDISLYETPLRGYDMQIGRFGAIDVLAEQYHVFSGYAFVGNNPIVFSDPSGAKRSFLADQNPNIPNPIASANNSSNSMEIGLNNSESFFNIGGGGSGGSSQGNGDLSYNGLAAISVFNSIKNAYNNADANGNWSYTAGGPVVITPEMVASYLASQHPDWDNIKVTETSGYSKKGAGFSYSYGVLSGDGQTSNNPTKLNDVVLVSGSFISMEAAGSIMSQSPYTSGGMDFTNLSLLSLGTTEKLVNYGGGVETLSNFGEKAMKFSKGLGVVGSSVTASYSWYKVYNQYENGGENYSAINKKDLADASIGTVGVGAGALCLFLEGTVAGAAIVVAFPAIATGAAIVVTGAFIWSVGSSVYDLVK